MRLSQYLKEAVIQPNKRDVAVFKKHITNAYKEFIKGNSKYPHTRTGVNKAMQQAAKYITKDIKDLEVKFKVKKGYSIEAGAMAGDPHYLEVEYNTLDAYEDWMQSEYLFDEWLEIFMNLVKHELVHIEQYRRILKNKGDIQQVNNILFHTKQRASDKYQGDLESYLSTHIEIMAHAKQASDQLKYFDKDDLMRALKDPTEMENLGMESSAFDSYYSWMRPYFPKVWKKFIKALVSYINKR